ncbi:MAG: hypothetical protein CFE26_02920 [Verrucomicrobiales bacterium VVV1]|nr:MAG: hypothetical protein CFE26_02920 [Verrucomicrobiales bacterium VVV1]
MTASIFSGTGMASLVTGKNYMKNRSSRLDKVHGRFLFYTCITFQFLFAAILIFAAYRWQSNS